MASRSPSNVNNNWGVVFDPASLYNVAGGPNVGTKLETGDIVFVTSTKTMYVCTDPTPGSATWEVTADGGFQSLFFNIPDPSTAGAGFVDGFRKLDRAGTITSLVLTQVTDGSAGTTTIEIFKIDAGGAETSLDTISLPQGTGVVTKALPEYFIPSDNRVGVKVTAAQTGGLDATVTAVFQSPNLQTPAGILANVVEDTSPQLGGDLDVNGKAIVSTSGRDVVIDPDGTGIVKVTSQIVSPIVDLVPSSDPPQVTVDLSLGSSFRLTPVAATRFLKPTNARPGAQFTVQIEQDAVGGAGVNVSDLVENGVLASGFQNADLKPNAKSIMTCIYNDQVSSLQSDTGGTLDASASPTIRLTETGGPFSAADVGKTIKITNSAANNGSFVISNFVDTNNVEWENASSTTSETADWETFTNGYAVMFAKEPNEQSSLIHWWRIPDGITDSGGDLTGWTDKIGSEVLSNGTLAPKYPSSEVVTNAGGSGNLVNSGAPTIQITKTTGTDFAATDVGRHIKISGGSASSNGTFEITEYVSTTVIKYYNPNGSVDDTGVTWSIVENVVLNTENTPYWDGDTTTNSASMASATDVLGASGGVLPNNTQYTLIILMRNIDWTALGTLLQNGVGCFNPTNMVWGIAWDEDNAQAVHDDTTLKQTASIALVKNEWVALHTRFNSTDGNVRFGKNGDPATEVTVAAGALDTSKLNNKFKVGNAEEDSEFNVMDIKLFSKNLTDAELRFEVEQIASFRGLTL